MRLISSRELKNKEIININNGKSMGFVSDIEIDLEKARIESIIVPGDRGFFGMFSGSDEYVIRWKDVKVIGEDVILVNIPLFGEEQDDMPDEKEEAGGSAGI